MLKPCRLDFVNCKPFGVKKKSIRPRIREEMYVKTTSRMPAATPVERMKRGKPLIPLKVPNVFP